ncbi:hypothetical protein P171DRAFT_485607 [Karstenula rhodostoma CBS 690.94]|uniref:Uncharacterized protein n=1 Tax=Karstenula rhodostoma CBS 690.94 TaxID=1392251 RepID=A0A9P4PFL1_9PLEO|nr:hypothetical protein P171DRAFT_485607 [Karstenula rhodostoma CBS 690.94]
MPLPGHRSIYHIGLFVESWISARTERLEGHVLGVDSAGGQPSVATTILCSTRHGSTTTDAVRILEDRASGATPVVVLLEHVLMGALAAFTKVKNSQDGAVENGKRKR